MNMNHRSCMPGLPHMRLMCLASVSCALLAVVGCGPKNLDAKLSLLEKDWRQECESKGWTRDGTTYTKDAFQETQEALGRLYVQRFNADERRLLLDTFHQWPVGNYYQTTFQNSLITAAFWYAVENRDRQTVVRILAETAIEFSVTLELRLVEGAAKYFDDPILIMLDAHDSSTRPEARDWLLTQLREDFVGVVDEGDLNTFVQRCRSWYIEHRKEIMVNPKYPSFPDRQPLFVPKGSG